LQEKGYINLYQREPKKYGWETNVKTRANMLSNLQECIKDSSAEIRDRDTLDECYNFIRHENGDIKARTDCFDDRVVSLAIALQICRVNPFYEPSKRWGRGHSNTVLPARSKRRTGY